MKCDCTWSGFSKGPVSSGRRDVALNVREQLVAFSSLGWDQFRVFRLRLGERRGRQ